MEREVSCAALLKALADETRLGVVRRLLRNPCHVGELQDSLGIEQSLLSHHLRHLRESGIVSSRRDGKAVLYAIAPSVENLRHGEVIDLGCCQLSFSPSPA